MACSSSSGPTQDKAEQFQYVTKNLVNQEFELEARAKLVKIKSRIKLQTVTKQTQVKAAALSFSNEFLGTKLSDVIQFLGNPQTTKEFAKRVEDYASEPVESESENSENQITDHNLNYVKGLPPKTPKSSKRVFQAGPSSSATKFTFPSVAELRNPLKTPLNNNMNPSSLHTPMFSFGKVSEAGGLLSAIKKTPRPAKPGEPVFTFSATGSPVINAAGTTAVPPSTSRRMKLDAGNGKVIDVDLVYRGGAEDEKMFGKIVTDFRGFCASRSAMSTTRKMLPPRVIVNKKRTKSLVRKSIKRHK